MSNMFEDKSILKDTEKFTGLNPSTDFVCQVNKNGTLLDFRGCTNNKLLVSSAHVLGKNIHEVILSHAGKQFMDFIKQALQTKELQVLKYRLLVSGIKHYYEASFIASEDDKVVVIVRDMKEYKDAEERMMYLAYHDTLTNLPNRYLFKENLKHAIANTERNNRLLALLFLDIDNFKNVNDTLGHNVGDHLLKSVADRLLKCVRKSDSISRLSTEVPNFMVARIGGDEFTLLLTNITAPQDLAVVSNRILNALSQPFHIENHEIFLTVSIGIALYPSDAQDADTLLKNADIALYQAKNQGRNNFQFYAESANVHIFERYTIENKLRRALDLNEFMLFYQPQVDISTGKIVGVESLIRWMQPDLIIVKPGEFIPMAEETGLIMPIGEWVLRTACMQNRAWQESGLENIYVSVNVSSVQFEQKDFVEIVARTLKETQLDPQYLQLELTETAIMQNVQNTVEKLVSLQNMGIKISIDDFGTGYSSLSYLKRFPISVLKIDQSFIHDLIINPEDQSITKAIISLAHNLNIKVIAEGVETKQQSSFLNRYGCDGMQGHVICPPLNADALMQFLRTKTLSKIR